MANFTEREVAFYEAEKAREQTEDMRMYIQIIMENRDLFTVGS